jgi:hypothetical protein
MNACDLFFWPPAVNATVSAIPGARNQVYAPANHRLTGIPDGKCLDLLCFEYWLKGEGQPFPTVEVKGCQTLPDGGKRVTFFAQGPLPVNTATLYVTAGGESWESSTWEPVAAQPVGENRFQATLPVGKVNARGAWFVNVSDARPATAGRFIYGMADSDGRTASQPRGTSNPVRKIK